MSKKKLILLELNEINFDLSKMYGEENYSSFHTINNNLINTKSEEDYHNLEPWIQWVSIHTGLSASQHKVFRLGDISNFNNLKQIFEFVESKGFRVGCIAPMNTTNKLNNPSYFIPDPWTLTGSDKSFWSKLITKTIRFMVNNNARNKVGIKNYFYLILIFFRFSQVKNYLIYIKLICMSIKKKWNKALVLDLLLHDIHVFLLNKNDPDFSTIFFNAGAHIQHHYLLTSKYVNHDKSDKGKFTSNKFDAFRDMLSIYNVILDDYLKNEKYEIILATGLSQKPYDKLEYYYRLNNHAEFLNLLNINYDSVLPRMSRDFLIHFKSNEALLEAEIIISSISVTENKKLFTIDKRSDSLFITLSYPDEIYEETTILINDREINLLENVSLVAIKNAEHAGNGYAYYDKKLNHLKLNNGDNITKINKSIKNYFDH